MEENVISEQSPGYPQMNINCICFLKKIVSLILKAHVCVCTDIRHTSEIFNIVCFLCSSVNINVHITVNHF